MFRTDCKKFYNLLRQKNTNVKYATTKEEIENFWKEIFGKKFQHNEEAYWIKNQCQQNPSIEWSPISETEVTEVLRMMLNWTATGRDQITNVWLKQLKQHTHISHFSFIYIPWIHIGYNNLRI